MDLVVQNDLIAAIWAALDSDADEGDVRDVVEQAFQACVQRGSIKQQGTGGRRSLPQVREAHPVGSGRTHPLLRGGLLAWLTGEILYFPIADGSAAYMVAEGSKTILIHLPIHDAWSLPDWQLRGLTKTEVKNRVAADKRWAKLFGKKGA